MKTYVLDSSALIAALKGEARADKVKALLGRASARQPLLMSVVNWGEVYSFMWRGWGRGVADARLLDIARLPVQLVDVDRTAAKLAATVKVRFGLPYADCFAAALAWSRDAVLVTADHDFRVLRNLLELVMV